MRRVINGASKSGSSPRVAKTPVIRCTRRAVSRKEKKTADDQHPPVALDCVPYAARVESTRRLENGRAAAGDAAEGTALDKDLSYFHALCQKCVFSLSLCLAHRSVRLFLHLRVFECGLSADWFFFSSFKTGERAPKAGQKPFSRNLHFRLRER